METKKDNIHLSMKVDRLETHDRLLEVNKQNYGIAECCQDLINQRPFGEVPFYIFAHTRTDDDGFTQRLIWQPRLTKPQAQTNSMLFKAYPGNDTVRIIWIIPKTEMWAQYQKGKVTESDIVCESIRAYQHEKHILEEPEKDDLSDAQIMGIYSDISNAAKQKNKPYKMI